MWNILINFVLFSYRINWLITYKDLKATNRIYQMNETLFADS